MLELQYTVVLLLVLFRQSIQYGQKHALENEVSVDVQEAAGEIMCVRMYMKCV